MTYSVVCNGCTEVLHVPSPNPGSMQKASTLPSVIVQSEPDVLMKCTLCSSACDHRHPWSYPGPDEQKPGEDRQLQHAGAGRGEIHCIIVDRYALMH